MTYDYQHPLTSEELELALNNKYCEIVNKHYDIDYDSDDDQDNNNDNVHYAKCKCCHQEWFLEGVGWSYKTFEKHLKTSKHRRNVTLYNKMLRR
jgi:hypothetical protein